jgi:hypothetical protein
MAQWKKVIVSGSTANLANVQVDGLTSGNVVIGGGTAGNLTTTAINGTGNIVATTGASGLVHSGSFSGSFTGNFVGNLTGTATTASNITPAITNNTDNYILTATGNNPNGESNLTFDGTTLTVTGNATITNNLIVQGTASFQNTTNLEVADRFVLFASGSNTAGDGGIVVQQGTQNVGELYGYNNATTRWGFTSSFSADQSSFTPIAHITTTEFAASNPSTAPIYGGSSNGYGNIHVNSSTGDIFIYA